MQLKNRWSRAAGWAMLGWSVANLASSLAWGQFAGVLTAHNDNSRTGQNLNETILSPANVNSTQFGKLATYAVDGQIYAQPLYVPNLSISGRGLHNVVYVATENDSVYAFDADALSTTPLWHTAFANSEAGITPIPCSDAQSCDINPKIGITSTPVIDLNAQAIYVVAHTKENGSYYQRLHALDITTGAEKFGGPVIIQATVPGTGAGSVNGEVSFDALREGQRPGLAEYNGVIYIGWASHGDTDPYHGWVMGYEAQTLEQVAVFNDDPNGTRCGIWQSGNGLAIDSSGNIFLQTGNGTFDVNVGGIDYGDSLLKLSTSSGLVVTDYFTPFFQNYLSNNDLDLGSGGVLLLPDQPGTYPHEAVSIYKLPTIWLTNRDNLGGYSSGTNNVIEQVPGAPGGYWSSPAYFNNAVYLAGVSGPLTRYPLTSGGQLAHTPQSQSSTNFGYPGATPSISANGTANGIVWAIQGGGAQVGGPPAILHAYSAADVSQELYNSTQAGSRDLPGPATKFSVPTIANGKVYIGTQTDLDIYGLLP